MPSCPRSLAALAAVLALAIPDARSGELRHHLFVNRDRDALRDAALLATPALAGAEVKYTWRALDGRIEALVLSETAIEFGATARYRPAGFSPEAYLRGMKAQLAAAHATFRHSHVIQYANFMPGRDPGTGKPVTVPALVAFARDSLRLDYVFWGMEEPYFSRDVLPWLRAQRAGGGSR